MQVIVIIPEGDERVWDPSLKSPLTDDVKNNLIAASKAIKKLEESLPRGWIIRVEKVV